MKSTFGPVSSLLLGVAFLIAGNGLQFTLIPLGASAYGWSAVQIGTIGSAYYIGFALGCVGGPYVILRAGHIRAFAAAVSLAAAAVIAHALWIAFPVWFLLRIVTGASLAALYLIIESWLNDRATNDTRGIIMSAYIVVNFTAITLGQLAVTIYPPTELSPFALATLVMCLATIPVALTRSAQPAPIALVRIHPRSLYRASPVAVVGVAVIGLANGAFWALGPVAAVRRGLSVSEAAIFMSVATVGGALMQWPAGRISDRVDRRLVLMALLIAAAAIGLALALLPPIGVSWAVLAFLFGAATLPTYAIAAAHAYDHAPQGGYVETAAGILLANAAGSVVGPVIASAFMQQAGASALFLYMAAAQVALAGYVYLRLRRRAPLPPTEKTEFDLAATAPVGAVIPPGTFDATDASVVAPGPPNATADHRDTAA